MLMWAVVPVSGTTKNVRTGIPVYRENMGKQDESCVVVFSQYLFYYFSKMEVVV